MIKDLDALKTEIDKDPAGLGLAALSAKQDDPGIAAALLSPDGPGAESRYNKVAPVGQIKFLLLAANQSASALSDTAQKAAWQESLQFFAMLVADGAPVDCSETVVSSLLESAISDKLLTQEQVDMRCKRAYSRAELVEGIGADLTYHDVTEALADERRAVYDAAQSAIDARAKELLAQNVKWSLERARMVADNELNDAGWDLVKEWGE